MQCSGHSYLGVWYCRHGTAALSDYCGKSAPPDLPIRAFLYFAGLVGISTVFAFFTYLFALGRLAAGVASILVMCEIAFAVLYARLILAEVLSSLEISGALLVVLGGVIIAAPRKSRPQTSP
jgi:drug/metabolite transporter (DMT)-like permease